MRVRAREHAGGEPEQPGSLWLRWESLRPPGELAATRRRATAETLFAELFRHPPERRSRVLQKSPHFREPALAELLLEKSRQAQPGSPERADAFAVLAAVLALQLYEPGESSALVAVFLGRANCLAGNARRLLGDESEAELAFTNAVAFLGRSAASCDRAFYSRFLALLRWGQGRIDEASALLQHAAHIFTENGAAHEEATSLALLGLLYTEEGDSERAVPLLRRALVALEPDPRPWLALRARLALALGTAQLGQRDRARGVLREAWQLYPGVTDEVELIRCHWLEGRIDAIVGPADDGLALLDAARARFVHDGRLPEAALATLDLAFLLAESGRREGMASLIAELEQQFGDADGVDIALRGLRGFDRCLAEGKSAGESAAGLTSYMRRTFRFRGFRFEPLTFV
jgi:tetratricopeptide (TPR) repeat protein